MALVTWNLFLFYLKYSDGKIFFLWAKVNVNFHLCVVDAVFLLLFYCCNAWRYKNFKTGGRAQIKSQDAVLSVSVVPLELTICSWSLLYCLTSLEKIKGPHQSLRDRNKAMASGASKVKIYFVTQLKLPVHFPTGFFKGICSLIVFLHQEYKIVEILED